MKDSTLVAEKTRPQSVHLYRILAVAETYLLLVLTAGSIGVGSRNAATSSGEGSWVLA